MTNNPVELQDAIERVARAICAATNGPLEGGSWALLGDKSKERIRKEARAAIAAMQGDVREALEEALSWAEGHDPWLVDQIRNRAALSSQTPLEGDDG